MGVHASGHHQSDEVTGVGADHGEAALVRSITNVGKEEDDGQRERGADCGEGVGGGAVESERPGERKTTLLATTHWGGSYREDRLTTTTDPGVEGG